MESGVGEGIVVTVDGNLIPLCLRAFVVNIYKIFASIKRKALNRSNRIWNINACQTAAIMKRTLSDRSNKIGYRNAF